MSKLPRGQCGKVVFPTKRMANERKNRLMGSKRSRNKPRELRTYFCDKCNGWHLTGMPLGAWERLKDED